MTTTAPGSFTDKFERDVATHAITVIRDDGLHRHIRFSRPDTNCMAFDLVTWPGYLCYSGDMGCFVFSRLQDMFEFFRRDADRLYQIDIRYWAEKVQAADARDGVEQYSPNRFTDAIKDRFDEYVDDGRQIEAAELWREIEDQVLSRADEEAAARDAADRFTFKGRQVFRDFWETRLNEYTARFLWCCHALAWGINRYDSATARRAQATGDAS